MSKTVRCWAACCATNQVDEHEQLGHDGNAYRMDRRQSQPLPRRSRRVSIPSPGLFHLDQLLPLQLMRPTPRGANEDNESSSSSGSRQAQYRPTRNLPHISEDSNRTSGADSQCSSRTVQPNSLPSRTGETSDSNSIESTRNQSKTREDVYRFLGIRDTPLVFPKSSVARTISSVRGTSSAAGYGGTYPIVAVWAIQASTWTLNTPPGPRRAQSPLLPSSPVSPRALSPASTSTSDDCPSNGSTPHPTLPLTKANKQLTQYRRNSVEEYMNELDSLSPIEGLESLDNDTSEEMPIPKAALFVSSSEANGEEEQPKTYQPSPVSLKIPKLPTYYVHLSSPDNKAAGAPFTASQLSLISARSRSDRKYVHIPTPTAGLVSNISALISTGNARLTKSNSRRAMAAQLRFERRVPCTAIVLRSNEASMILLDGFHVMMKDTVLGLCRGNQQKRYMIADLLEVDCTARALEGAKAWIQARTAIPQEIPTWPEEIDASLQQMHGRVIVLKYVQKRIPVIIIFESEEDLTDFVELLGLAAKHHRRDTYHAISWKFGD